MVGLRVAGVLEELAELHFALEAFLCFEGDSVIFAPGGDTAVVGASAFIIDVVSKLHQRILPLQSVHSIGTRNEITIMGYICILSLNRFCFWVYPNDTQRMLFFLCHICYFLYFEMLQN